VDQQQQQQQQLLFLMSSIPGKPGKLEYLDDGGDNRNSEMCTAPVKSPIKTTKQTNIQFLQTGCPCCRNSHRQSLWRHSATYATEPAHFTVVKQWVF